MFSATRTLGSHTTVLFGADAGKYPDGNSVLVQGSHSSLLIDPSQSVHRASPAIEVDQVLLTHTHEDHLAGLSAVRAGAISVHEADLAALHSLDGLLELFGTPSSGVAAMRQMLTERFHYVGWPHATGFADGAEWDLGGVVVRAVHTPGHTAGHCVFVIEPDDGSHRVVVLGDIDLTGFGPYYGDAQSSLTAFEATLAMLPSIEADHYVTYHHKGVVDGHDAFVAALAPFTAMIGRREHALLGLLAAPQTFDELLAVGIVYRPGTRPPLLGDVIEANSIRMHLDRLVAVGDVVSDGTRYRFVND
jgi:glyoxylase-like metal-dependent hydrolase (beta-lactamase superfamily II)